MNKPLLFFVVSLLIFLVVAFSRVSPPAPASSTSSSSSSSSSSAAPASPLVGPDQKLATPVPLPNFLLRGTPDEVTAKPKKKKKASPAATAPGGGASSSDEDPAVVVPEADLTALDTAGTLLGKDPNPLSCFNSSNEDAPQDVLTRRLLNFTAQFGLSRITWGPNTPVFPATFDQGSDAQQQQQYSAMSWHPSSAANRAVARIYNLSASPLNYTPAVMRQFLYCYTKAYVGADGAPENNNCLAEMAEPEPGPLNGGRYFIGSGHSDDALKTCTAPPIYQGNVTRWADLAPVVTQFPGPISEDARTLAAIAASRSWYWKAMPDPFKFTCPTCTETKNLISPSLLVGVRRWFPIQNWLVMRSEPSGKKGRAASSSSTTDATDIRIEQRNFQCLVFLQRSLRTAESRSPQTTCSGKGEPKEGDVNGWEFDVPFDQLVDVAFAHNAWLEDGFFIFTFKKQQAKKQPQRATAFQEAAAAARAGVDESAPAADAAGSSVFETHLVQPVRGLNGVDAIWMTLQMLYGADDAGSGRRVIFGPSSSSSATAMPLVPRNITAAAAEAGCLSIADHLILANAKQARKRAKDKKMIALQRCWRDVFAFSSPSSSESAASASLATAAATMVPQHRFPYLPCYPSYITALLAHARKHHNVDSHDVYWPFNCRAIAHRRGCLDGKIAGMLRLRADSPLLPLAASADGAAADPRAILRRARMSDLVKPRVAVCLAGFLRSFHLSRHALFRHLVDPFDADFFASSWNLQGRVKKTLPVLKGHIINVDRLKRRLIGLIPWDRGRNVTRLIEQGRYGVHVFSWNLYRQALSDHADVGWRHAGLYMLLSHSIDMAISSGRTHDVIIRGRFDLVPLAPLQILPVWAPAPAQSSSHDDDKNSSSSSTRVASWLLDTGASCEMDGFWWPRTALLRPGVIVAHTADTRFKLFSWQYCDWLHIADAATMKQLNAMSTYAIQNYVDSGAQFVEHFFAIDRGLRWVPMQLYLKILRETRKKKRGAKAGQFRIRMHLFG